MDKTANDQNVVNLNKKLNELKQAVAVKNPNMAKRKIIFADRRQSNQDNSDSD